MLIDQWNRKLQATKRSFDPLSKQDLSDYKHFLDHKRWPGNCPFNVEFPYLSVPDMIKTKIIETYLERIIKDAR